MAGLLAIAMFIIWFMKERKHYVSNQVAKANARAGASEGSREDYLRAYEGEHGDMV